MLASLLTSCVALGLALHLSNLFHLWEEEQMTCKVYKSGIQMQPANVSLFPDRETPGPFRTHCFLPTSLRASGQCAPLWEPISLHLFARFIQTSVLLLFESCFPHSSGRCSPSSPRTEWHSRPPCSLVACVPLPLPRLWASPGWFWVLPLATRLLVPLWQNRVMTLVTTYLGLIILSLTSTLRGRYDCEHPSQGK